MEKEKQLLLLCRKLIEQSLNWGDGSIWSNDDFEQLGEKIFDKTKVKLSVSTLKRIWGKVRYENFPTTATLNALAGFVGYESWRDFKQNNLVEDEIQITDELAPIQNDEAPAAAVSKIKWAAILIISVLAIGAIIFVISQKKTKPVDLNKIKFEAIKVSDSLPNSVVFNYDIAPFKADSAFIQQSWDPSRIEKIPIGSKQHTSIYYEPGIFIAKLVINNKVKKKCVLYIKTKGWKAIINKRPVPTYLSAKEIKGNGFMGVSDETLHKKTGLPVFNDTWTYFLNVHEFKDIDAGNFTFETTLRNASAVEASVCRKVRAIILGSSTAIIIPLGDKGCISTLDLWTGDQWIGGKDHDMSAFGCDFTKLQNLKCRVEKNSFKIYLNNELIFSTIQKHSLGEIVGIRLEFEGSAEIKNVKLSTPGSGSHNDNF
ncbi:hypothetical protein [Mucilaginibacter sp. OK098]|uniref:hypothetical protein n=1 Tax=Mucilaginibacter sp. OK098 TaxID=1855297 RepID=UPI00091B4EBD|nr:hypothetical protein [Mucilaginibacter sp. OK098]SHN27753.1 hypothetical protein SAMN05216524_10871 [Mucilaginibacter sp. OK098]